MPRKRCELRPLPAADSRFNSVLVTRLINKMNFEGQKNKATRIVYKALEHIKGNGKDDPLAVLSRAVENARPLLETKPRQVGGATYQVPIEVRWDRSMALAMRWLVSAARARGEKGMMLRLAGELTDAFEHKGAAVKRRETMHQMAKANQAFAHFRLN